MVELNMQVSKLSWKFSYNIGGSSDTAMIVGNSDGSMIMGGHVTMGDNDKVKLGSEGELFTDGTDLFLSEVGDGAFKNNNKWKCN